MDSREELAAELPEEDRERLLEVADSVWLAARKAPPLEDDPVAHMLGLA